MNPQTKPALHDLPEPERFELHEPQLYFFRPTRRQFLETAAGGLLIVAVQPSVQGQRPPGDAQLEARIHLGVDGKITILSGKIEEGQGARTEIAMAAAEELGLPLSAITVTLADTDQVPNDGTTAGSRTTPATVPLVRRACAATRQLLVRVAAEQWQIDAAQLRLLNGSATDSSNQRRFSYQDLAQTPAKSKAFSQPLPNADAVPLAAPAGWMTLGTPRTRINSRDLVTGQHRFPSDIERPGMLFANVLRAPAVGAKLLALDLDAARKMKDVVAVRDKDFAGCAAPTSHQARKAVQALSATAKWETKDYPSSDSLFDYLKQHAQPGGERNRPAVRGDVDTVLRAATNIVQATYTTAYVQHAPMEPRAAVAEWQDGRLTVWTGTSNPFSVRDQLAQAFQLPVTSVRVIVPDFGGGFGGKHTGEAAIEAARLAREANRPVSLRWTRAEEFMWAYCRPAARIEVTAALSGEGKIQAWNLTNWNSGGSALETPYRIANTRHQFIPSDSPLRQGSYRALASTANNFARESFMDELAAVANRDPLEFRLDHLDNERIRAVLEAAAKKFNWPERRKAVLPNRGVGLSCGTEKNSVVAACVEVEVDPKTGTLRLIEICQAFECGSILNPANLRAQVEGAIIMGLGAALREELQFQKGRLTNGRFSTYLVPRFRDVPKMDLVFLNKPDAEPIGAGETPIIAVAPAMAAAIFAASGQRLRAMPFRLASVAPQPAAKSED